MYKLCKHAALEHLQNSECTNQSDRVVVCNYDQFEKTPSRVDFLILLDHRLVFKSGRGSEVDVTHTASIVRMADFLKAPYEIQHNNEEVVGGTEVEMVWEGLFIEG